MAPGKYALAASAVALLLPQKNADAFMPCRPALTGRRSSNGIMNMGLTSPASGVGRGAFLKELASGVAVGTVAFGLTVEGAGAYEKEYLKDPTDEFKAMEARQSEFAAVQRAYKKDFTKILDAFLAAQNDQDAITNMNAMSKTVIQRGGLPESVRIDDLLKTCRRKKAAMKSAGNWGTPAQIAYEMKAKKYSGLDGVKMQRKIFRCTKSRRRKTLVQTTNRTVVPQQSGS